MLCEKLAGSCHGYDSFPLLHHILFLFIQHSYPLLLLLLHCSACWQVTLYDHSTCTARVVGYDAAKDIAGNERLLFFGGRGVLRFFVVVVVCAEIGVGWGFNQQCGCVFAQHAPAAALLLSAAAFRPVRPNPFPSVEAVPPQGLLGVPPTC
jgi:hypothetical protein